MMTAFNPFKVLNSLDDISYSAVISDLDGVVYRGDEVIEHAVDRFNYWQSQGVPYCFVTNNAEKSSAEFADKICRMGIDCDANQVVTSADAAFYYVTSKYAVGSTAYVIGSPSLKARTEAAGYKLVSHSADFVLVALDRNFNYAMMKDALCCVLDGAELIGTNPDVIRPIPGGYEPGSGAILQSIATAARVTPHILGKPNPVILLTALERLRCKPDQAIMLGDQLATDIACAQNAGIRGVFLETGVPLDKTSSIIPDYLATNLAL